MAEQAPPAQEGQPIFEQRPLDEYEQARDRLMQGFVVGTLHEFLGGSVLETPAGWIVEAVRTGFERGNNFWNGSQTSVTREARDAVTIPMLVDGVRPEIQQALDATWPGSQEVYHRMAAKIPSDTPTE